MKPTQQIMQQVAAKYQNDMTQEELAKLPNDKLQKKSRSATGEYWYDLEPRKQKNTRFMRRFELRLK